MFICCQHHTYRQTFKFSEKFLELPRNFLKCGKQRGKEREKKKREFDLGRKMLRHFFPWDCSGWSACWKHQHAVNLCSSAPRALITDHVQCNASKALGPTASSWGPASFFYGNCWLAAGFIFFLSFHDCCIYLNIHIKLEAVTQAENSETNHIQVKSFVVINLPRTWVLEINRCHTQCCFIHHASADQG